MSTLYQTVRHSLRRPTRVECVVVVAIITVLIALLLPTVQWASSGSIRFPVRVFVFDATRGMPLADAQVAIFRAPFMSNANSLKDYRDRYDVRNVNQIPTQDGFGKGVTGTDGTTVIEFDFRTGASHQHPEAQAHLANAWVCVRVKGFGGVVVPVRQDPQPTATMRKQNELFVPIGLTPAE